MYDNNEDYSNDRECHIEEDDDDDDISYIETDRSSAVFNATEQRQHSTLPDHVSDGVSDDSDDEKNYMALRSLVLYGNKSVCLFGISVFCINFKKT